MVPPAPVGFSMITGCPSGALIRSARMRASASVGPPAGKGTTMVIGRVDRLVPSQCATRPAARQHPRPDAENVGGRVDEEVAHPHPSQTRMCRFPSSGSSWESLAHGGADDTIRDLPAKKDSGVGRPPSFPFLSVQLPVVVSWTGL